MTIRPSSRSNGHPAQATPRVTDPRGFSSGAEEPAGDPGDGVAAFSGSRGTRRRPGVRHGRLRQTSPHLNTPHHNHKAPHLNRANHSPCLPSGERSPGGREGRARGAVRTGACRVRRASRDPGHLGDLGYLGTPRRAGRPGYLRTRDFGAVEAVSRRPAKNAIIAQNDQKRPSKNRTTTTSAQMR